MRFVESIQTMVALYTGHTLLPPQFYVQLFVNNFTCDLSFEIPFAKKKKVTNIETNL